MAKRKEHIKSADEIAEETQRVINAYRGLMKTLLDGELMDTATLLRDTKAYKKVIKHRNTCPDWGNQFCLKCFGGGLTKFVNELFTEIKTIRTEKRKGQWRKKLST